MLLQWVEGKPLQLANNTCRARSFLLVGSEIWGAAGNVSEGHRCPLEGLTSKLCTSVIRELFWVVKNIVEHNGMTFFSQLISVQGME